MAVTFSSLFFYRGLRAKYPFARGLKADPYPLKHLKKFVPDY